MLGQGIEPLALTTRQNERQSILQDRAGSGRYAFQSVFSSVTQRWNLITNAAIPAISVPRFFVSVIVRRALTLERLV